MPHPSHQGSGCLRRHDPNSQKWCTHQPRRSGRPRVHCGTRAGAQAPIRAQTRWPRARARGSSGRAQRPARARTSALARVSAAHPPYELAVGVCQVCPDARLPSECASFDAYLCAHGRLIPVCELCQREAAGARLVRVVKLASMRLRELRGGLRRIGATCTAAQTRIRCKDVATQEYRYDQNGGGIRRRHRVPVGMASFASQRPIARIVASGSAKLWLPSRTGCRKSRPVAGPGLQESTD